MKARTSFLKRSLALALALVLLVSSANTGILYANAAGVEKTVGQIVAANYDLTDAEKALLSSGNLAGGSKSYTEPDAGLVEVDTGVKQITASGNDGWVATQAAIVVDGVAKETVTLTDGKGTYTYGGNNFAVQVTYVLNMDIDADVQKQLLNTAGWLKSGVAGLKAAYDGSDTNLGTIVLAMDTLEDLANGINMNLGAFSMTARFKEDAQAAVKALRAEMNANNGELALQVFNKAYNAAASKTQYLLNNGAAYKAAAEKTLANLSAIKNDALLNNELLDGYLQGADPASYTKWMAMKKILGNVVTGLEGALAKDWTAAEKGTALVSDSVNYADLDDKVAALGEITPAPAVKNPLRVAETSVTKNLNMNNVTVKVVLLVVEDKADSDKLVEKSVESKVLTLPTDASTKEIQAAADAVVKKIVAAWTDVPVEHFEFNTTELPAKLTEDIDYTVTYEPKTYKVTTDYAGELSLPYGYQYTLPAHSDATKAYDYTVNGAKKAQGEVVVIEGETTISRTSGKSYATGDLYGIVADNYANAVAKDILKSGALNDNVTVNYRKPDPADAASLLTLLDGVLTAVDYDAAYNGLKWAPYTYGAEGTEKNFSGNTASWTGKQVKVTYKLALENFGKDKAQEVLDLAVTLKTEFETQKGAMDSLAGMEETLKMLDKAKLGALNGVIDVTDFSADTAENEEIKAELKAVVGNIIKNNLDTNNYLKIYNMVVEYNTNGMRYYYENYETIKAEVNSLAAYMTELMDNEEALKTMCSAAGFPEYADKISDVETKLNDYNSKLSAPNAAINVSSADLGKLITALSAEGDAKSTAAGAPYILSEPLTAQDKSAVMVQIIIETPEGNAAVTTDSMDRGTVFTQAMYNDLKAKADAKVAELLGANAKYYAKATEGTDLAALVGTELSANANTYYTYTEKEYTVKIDGENDQIVTISDLEIDLPKHPTAGYTYKYTVDGVADIVTSAYTFTAEQIDRLFKDGTYTITRVEINEAKEKLEGNFADWIVKDTNGNIIGLHANVAGDQNGIMEFAMTLVNAGYTYIGLNGEAFLYMNEENTTELCLQTLVNAILKDNTFSHETLINLGENGKGKLVQADLQLGNSADDLHFEHLDFVMNLTSVPSQMATVAKGLKTLSPYIRFNSNNGVMDVKLDMPKPVYAAYLTALVSVGEVDANDINAVNSEIAYEYLWDFVENIVEDDAITTTTYTNTLKKLGINKDLTGAEKYYQLVRKALTADGVKINPDENGKFDMSIEGKSQKAINSLISFLGIDVSAYEMYLGMIKEYKYEDATLSANCNAILVDAETDVDALLLDLNADGVANKVEYTTNLPARIKSAAKHTVVILTDDVDGDLNFPAGTTVLDLNGKTVKGNVSTKGELYIIDSNMVTANEGGITGSVKATAILAGTYSADVTSYLASGYEQVNGVVQNALYTVEGTETAYNYVIDTDFMGKDDISYSQFAPALAVDMTVDVILNYYTAAAMSVDGNGLYQLNFTDLITLITSDSKAEAVINKVLSCVDIPGIGETAELFLEDLLNFAAIRDGLNNGTPVAQHTITTAPMDIVINHKTDGDYMDIGFGPVAEKSKDIKVGITFVGENKYLNAFKNLVSELAEIVTTEVDITLNQPVLANKRIEAIGSFNATANVDMATDEYRTIVGVILAYSTGNDKIAEAVNAKDWDALKTYVDDASVADVFTALKKLSRNVKFADMADAVDVTIDTTKAAEIESAYHYILCAAGRLLEELEITGYTDKKMGALYDEATGLYVLDKKAFTKDAAVTKRGYTAYAKLTLGDFILNVDLWSEDDCLWGDMDHDGDRDEDDASAILRHAVGLPTTMFCEKRADVNADGFINEDDASWILRFAVGLEQYFPAELK